MLRKRSTGCVKAGEGTDANKALIEPHQLESFLSRETRNTGCLARDAGRTVTCETTAGRTNREARNVVMSDDLPSESTQ